MERLLANVEGSNPPELVHLVATPEGKLIVTGISGGGGSGSSVDRELIVSTYLCKVAITGAAVGDTITATQVIDVSGTTPSTVSTIWRNQTTATDLAGAPSAAALELTGSAALTATQLTAAGLATDAVAQAIRDRLPATPVSRGAGAVDAGTQRVVLASDGPTVTALQNIDTKTPALFGGAVPVVGPLTATQLAAAALATDAVVQAIRDRLPSALSGGRLSVSSSIPTASIGTILAVTTAATGTTYTPFTGQACIALDIVNNTGTTIEYRRGATGTAMQIPTGAARMVIGITNANQIDIRRTDTSNTTVTLQAEAFTA